MSTPSQATTELLCAAREGQPGASEKLFSRLYDDLTNLARARLRQYGSGSTLNTSGLVHEAYLRLLDGGSVAPEDKTHFFALAARAMRYVLLDRYRARITLKRGGADRDFSSEIQLLAVDAPSLDLLALDAALEKLRARSERLATVVDLRFFAGLTIAEVSELTSTSVSTVQRDWLRARMWLFDFMSEPGDQLPPSRGQ